MPAKLHRKRLRIDVWIDVQMNNFWNTQWNFTLISLITFEVLNQTLSNLQGTCRNSSRCCPVFHVICRQHRLLLRQVPCKFDKVWLSTSKVINEISVKFHWVFQKLYIWTSIQTSFSTVFYVILQATSTTITASSL